MEENHSIYTNVPLFMSITHTDEESDNFNSTTGVPLSNAYLASKYLTFIVRSSIHFYLLPIIVPGGFVGNTLAFSVMMGKHNRHISCCL